MFACVWIQMCAHMHVPTCGGQRLMSIVLLDHSPFDVPKQGLSLNPRLAKVATLASYVALGSLFWSPEH